KEQVFCMKMMEQVQIQDRFLRFESGSLSSVHDILIRNKIEILGLNQKYSDKEVYIFAYDIQYFILLVETTRYDLLSKAIQEKRLTYDDKAIKYVGGDQQSAVTVELFQYPYYFI
ncbi:MAG: hypothetical protein EZS28_054938, partial [Streblomastix strix]